MSDDNMIILRSIRNKLLKRTDFFIMIKDYPITDSERDELLAYRNLLRDLPRYIIDNNIQYETNNLKQIFPDPPTWLLNYIDFN